MVKLTDKEITAIKDGSISTADFADALSKKYSAYDIALAFCELITLNEVVSEKAITVTQSEYDRICSLFRIQGSSNRGRKKKIQQ